MFNKIIPIVWILITQLFNNFYCTPDEPIGSTKNGLVKGFTYNLNNKIKSDVYLGIPYGKANRFEKPVEPDNWVDIRNAITLPPACQTLQVLSNDLGYSEDCLFLNVMKPQNNTKLLPVAVFIHGGAFLLGGNFIERYQNLTENFIPKNIVVVTIQYRLGFFGFFSDGTSNLPGNYGLWDQRQALLWVQNNIAQFGGDPTQVTIWGQSAGSASVSMLTLSKHTQNLFKQVFEQSGSSLGRWALNSETVQYSQALAAAINCTNSNETLKECIKNVSFDSVQTAMLTTVGFLRGTFDFSVLNPRFDNDFFDVDFNTAISQVTKPTIIGYNSDESSFLAMQYGGIFGVWTPLQISNYSSFGKTDLVNFINTQIHSNSNNVNSTILNEIANEIINYYINETEAVNYQYYYLHQYIRLLTDVQFIIPGLFEARQKASLGWPVYVYHFNYTNPAVYQDKPIKAIEHGADYPFLEGVYLFNQYVFNNEDSQIRKYMLNAVSNFIKTGNPSTCSIYWPKITYNSSNSCSVSTLTVTSQNNIVVVNEISKRLCFWEQLNEQYDLSLVAGLPTYNIYKN